MPERNNLTTLALIIGIISVAFSLSGMSFPVGALGIIIAILSRGSEPMAKPAKIGLALSMAGIAIGVCVYIWTFFIITSEEYAPFFQQALQMYGAA